MVDGCSFCGSQPYLSRTELAHRKEWYSMVLIPGSGYFMHWSLNLKIEYLHVQLSKHLLWIILSAWARWFQPEWEVAGGPVALLMVLLWVWSYSYFRQSFWFYEKDLQPFSVLNLYIVFFIFESIHSPDRWETDMNIGSH